MKNELYIRIRDVKSAEEAMSKATSIMEGSKLWQNVVAIEATPDVTYMVKIHAVRRDELQEQ